MNLRRPRTLLVLATAALALTVPVAAEADPTLHLRAGLVTSRFTLFGSSTGYVDSGGFGPPGFTVGAGLRVPVSERFRVQVEAFYVRKAGYLDVAIQSRFRPDFWNNFRLRTTIDYVELPLTVRYEFPVDSVRPYFIGGAAYAIKTGASTDLQTELALRDIQVGPVDGFVNDSDVTIVLGAGVEFATSPWAFELRASLGLRPVFEEALPSGRLVDSSAKARAFMFMVGYRF